MWALGVAAWVSGFLAGCSREAPGIRGTLEWDRISLPAPVSEPIAEILVLEGDRIPAGTPLLSLDPERTASRLAGGQAEVDRLRGRLDELRAGPRIEDRDEARARLRASESLAEEAGVELARIERLVAEMVLPQAELDRARSQLQTATANVDATRAVLTALQRGTRSEQISQAAAALEVALAQVRSLEVDQRRVQIIAPRAGFVETLPFKVGDQPPQGAALVFLLVGETPYARIYVPETVRMNVRVGSAATVWVEGYLGDGALGNAATGESAMTGTARSPRGPGFRGAVRAIRSEPTFTPYYALSGKDAARLSYLAEVQLGDDAKDLPAGLPVHVEIDGAPIP